MYLDMVIAFINQARPEPLGNRVDALLENSAQADHMALNGAPLGASCATANSVDTCRVLCAVHANYANYRVD